MLIPKKLQPPWEGVLNPIWSRSTSTLASSSKHTRITQNCSWRAFARISLIKRTSEKYQMLQFKAILIEKYRNLSANNSSPALYTLFTDFTKEPFSTAPCCLTFRLKFIFKIFPSANSFGATLVLRMESITSALVSPKLQLFGFCWTPRRRSGWLLILPEVLKPLRRPILAFVPNLWQAGSKNLSQQTMTAKLLYQEGQLNSFGHRSQQLSTALRYYRVVYVLLIVKPICLLMIRYVFIGKSKIVNGSFACSRSTN